MLVSFKWLEDYVSLPVTPEELAEKITRSGIEVDGIHRKGQDFDHLVAGRVLKCERHPNADKLTVCLVDIGEGEPVQIVCGAKNVAPGLGVIVAKPGAKLPNQVKIKKAKFRGVESNGMICSLQELGFEGKVVPKEYAEGIFVLPEDVPPGTEIASLLHLDDPVLELELTANRGDCLSMIGVAYETAAILGGEVRLPEAEYEPIREKAEDHIRVKVDSPEDCPLYTAKIIRNVKIGPSPLWMQARLMAAGIRPHNNVVDITNYVMLEYGQPLHAFDYDRFGSKEVVVRRAKDGEKLVTLDGVTRTLNENHLVITNGKEPVALAGVMGGADSEVTAETTTVLLESALFAGPVVRRASKDLQLRSESSSRFEKGVDPARVKEAAERAAALMARYASGEVLEGTAEARALQADPVKITVDLEKMNAFLGTELTMAEVAGILERLRFPYEQKERTLTVTVPTRRPDITREVDVYEEIARLYGYDLLPGTLPRGPQTPGGLTDYQKKRRIVKYFLEGAGLQEAITYTLTSREKFRLFSLTATEEIPLSLPMSEEHSVLRQSLLPHLLNAVRYNRARKNENIALYEIGSIFLSRGTGKQPEEREHLAFVLTGLWVDHPWQGERVKADFFTAKGILEQLFAKLGLKNRIRFVKREVEGFHPGQTAEILFDGEAIGVIGKIHPAMEKNWDIKDVFAAEIILAKLLRAENEPLVYSQVPRFPSVSRDIALVCGKDLSAGELKETIVAAGGKLLTDAKVFDVYEGEKMDADKKSVAFSLTFSDPERTLTDEEIDRALERILRALEEKGAYLRK
ncbi:phenylalanine--tRNA ligase subunit beta [Caldibacillus debilis]|jgi:phenylalanyl-tRNA synthetase beta chain|uniref:Phenylalanine--tRNA ligase beta subunit n=1 Tax=Caldibacillus debilis GB1 TaxID=1339248 RepID=A0A420VII3_9BACI|nr:phenylalanine--tRNA ligase subunit beta [Caldibacillus debilis]RKO63491.1 phenylalanyl-tRNA synthetase beta subunit [Caldibacillus debilis GB1]